MIRPVVLHLKRDTTPEINRPDGSDVSKQTHFAQSQRLIVATVPHTHTHIVLIFTQKQSHVRRNSNK